MFVRLSVYRTSELQDKDIQNNITCAMLSIHEWPCTRDANNKLVNGMKLDHIRGAGRGPIKGN